MPTRFSQSGAPDIVSLLAKVTLAISLLALLAVSILRIGGTTRAEFLQGPFAASASGGAELLLPLGRDHPFALFFSPAGPLGPAATSVWVNGVKLDAVAPAQKGALPAGSYSRQGDAIRLALPPGIENRDGTHAVVRYPVAVKPFIITLACSLLFLSAAIVGFRAWRRDPRRLGMGFRTAASAASRGLYGGMIAACVGGGAYFVAYLAGAAQGFFFPAAAVFTFLPWTVALAQHEPYVPHLVLLYALAGTILSWCALASPALTSEFRQREQRLIALWERYGLIPIAAFLVFSLAAAWHGIVRQGDLSYYAIAGFVPFSDAHGHFLGSFTQSADGTWDEFASRRPFAAALRGAVMFVLGYSNAAFLLTQAFCIALAAYFSARAVMRWRGLWAGIAFLGLILLLVRPYLPTNLTEPLGIFWSLVAIPFAVTAIRTGSPAAAGACLLTTCFALFTRMGSMFTIPAVALWIIWSRRAYGSSVAAASVAVGALLVLFVGFNSALLGLYGSTTGGGTGANFSFTACGLAHGGDWKACPAAYPEEYQKHRATAASETRFLYDKALQKLKDDPSVLLRRLAGAEWYFLTGLPRRILLSYPQEWIPGWFPASLFYVVALAGLFYALRKRREKTEASFWILTLGSVVASAPFVIFDDGWRVLCASTPLVALFISSGFISPLASPHSRAPAEHPGFFDAGSKARLAALVLVMLTCLIVPGIASRLDVLNLRALREVPTGKDQLVVLGGRHLSGFLIVPDGIPPPANVPAISLSSLERSIADSAIGTEQAPPVFPGTPFTFLAGATPRDNSVFGGRFLIGPPELVYRRDVAAWKLTLEGWDRNKTSYWNRVTDASPQPAPGE